MPLLERLLTVFEVPERVFNLAIGLNEIGVFFEKKKQFADGNICI